VLILERLRRNAGFLAGAALALPLLVLGGAWAVERMAERQLLADAERSTLDWAQHLSRKVPDIDLVATGDLPSPQAQDALAALRGTGGLFRFHLFDIDGRKVLVSDSLGTPMTGAAQQADPDARAVIAHGGARVSIQRAAGAAAASDDPQVWTAGYARITHGRQVVGAARIELDQSGRALVITQSFGIAAALAAALMSGLIAAGGALWRRRLAREQANEQRVRYLASHDTLTGTLNRAAIHDTLASLCHNALRDGRRFALLCVDIDRFKDVNDLHGHAVGDALLHRVAERLRALLRQGDELGRLGGDQFVVLQQGVDGQAAVAALAERVVSGLGGEHALGALRVNLSVCVGAAMLGVDGDQPATLLHAAELALARAKAAGPGSWGYYDAVLDRALHERRLLATELRTALAQDQLALHFQPVFAAGGALLGYEALARWPHATRGFVPPGEFIPLAEETGLIEPLGRWVLRTACEEAARWPEPLHVAVNLSPAQFADPAALIDLIQSTLASAGLPARRLEVEITESLLMGHTEQVLSTLNALRDLGVRIAMDDFGTGYSSLAYLWRFPFDKLKIDRAFTQRLGADGKVDVIVRSIVRLAHALAIRVNAEGVETDAQRLALREHGCDELQGFLLGRPQPPEKLVHRAAEALPAKA
jgi:diguanylate cyclase (GGDEF)-like protein